MSRRESFLLNTTGVDFVRTILDAETVSSEVKLISSTAQAAREKKINRKKGLNESIFTKIRINDYVPTVVGISGCTSE